MDDPVSIANARISIDWVKDHMSPDNDPTEPGSDLYYPIIDDGDDGGKVVGIFAMTFFFREFIENILPPGSDGVILIFDNACGQTFTYRLDGPHATYLGRGDLHDTEYDYMGTRTDLVQLFNLQAHDDSYTGLPLSQQQCSYFLNVYPSFETKDEYSTNNPITFTVVAILIFGFTSAIFLIYDCCVNGLERCKTRTKDSRRRTTESLRLLLPSSNTLLACPMKYVRL
jgi:hypothetical protein